MDDAVAYIYNGPRAMYGREGFGLYLTELKEDHFPIGLCGLIKRDGLEDGQLCLEQHWQAIRGYHVPLSM